jgi:hypothetical protein
VNTRISQLTGCFYDFRLIFPVPPGIGVGFTEKTEAAVIATVGTYIKKTVHENSVVEVLASQFSGCLKKGVDMAVLAQAQKKDNIFLYKHFAPAGFCQYSLQIIRGTCTYHKVILFVRNKRFRD